VSLLDVLQPLVLEPYLLGMDWMDPVWLLEKFGEALFWLSLAIIFVECGLFFPFLPGDSLLFAMGLFFAGEQVNVFPGPAWVDLLIGLALFTVAGFAGNVVGYEIGRKIGPALYEREGRVLKKKYFDQTSEFFDKHGSKALVIGRFVPFVRTYVTVVAGVTRMERHKFFLWSAIGAVLWVFSITLLGFFLGNAFPSLVHDIDKLILAIVAFSVIPMVWEWWRHKRTASPRADDNDGDGHPDRDIMGIDAD
jgi:membrane-associated protein